MIDKKKLEKSFFWKIALKDGNILSSDLSKLDIAVKKSVAAFYLLLFVSVVHDLYNLNYFIVSRPDSFLWPVFWAKYFPSFPWLLTFLIICFLSSFSSIFLFKKRIIRVFNFVVFFIFFSLINSFGKINHSLHTVLIPLFFFIFVDFKSVKKDYSNSVVYYSASFALLTTYFFAGFWKLLKGVTVEFEEGFGLFNSNEMLRLLEYMYRFEKPTLAAQFLIDYPVVGLFAHWSAILIEFFAVFIFFKPKLHIVWGFSLLLMHVGINAVMGADFSSTYLSIIPLLILNPFSVKKT